MTRLHAWSRLWRLDMFAQLVHTLSFFSLNSIPSLLLAHPVKRVWRTQGMLLFHAYKVTCGRKPNWESGTRLGAGGTSLDLLNIHQCS